MTKKNEVTVKSYFCFLLVDVNIFKLLKITKQSVESVIEKLQIITKEKEA
jgi:hypothetical protein